MNSDSPSLTIVQVLQLARRRAPLVLACFVLTTVAAFLWSKQQQKEYTATASILFRSSTENQQAAGVQVVVPVDPQAETDTNLKLATLPRIAASTAAALGNRMSPGSIRDAISVTPQTDTRLANVAATSRNPQTAAALANTYASEVIKNRQTTEQSYYSNALRVVTSEYDALTLSQRRGTAGASLRDRASSLQILSQLQGNDVQLAQAAGVPLAPSSPKVGRNTAIGAILGLLLGLVLAFLRERFDRRLREPGDIEAIYGVPLVGVVPESPALRDQGAGQSGDSDLPAAEAEVFSLLRAHIHYFNVDRKLRSVLIVSAAPGDGKTTVARNLALAMANVGSRVLFLEADLRRPTASQRFGVARSPGISEILMSQVPVDQAIQSVHFGHGGDGRIDVLVAGSVLPPNPASVLESDAMESLIDDVKADHDLVVIDTPPMAALSDAFPLVRLVDGVVIVSRLGRSRSDDAARLRDTLIGVDAPVIGVVANGYRRGPGSPYGYGAEYAGYIDQAATNGRATNGSVEDSSRFSAGPRRG